MSSMLPYSADGYARSHGMAALCTTYGVGELSAMNGVPGAYAENLPILLLVGMPASRTQAGRRFVHHTLGNGEFELSYEMAEPIVCARTIMTPENCAEETERLMAAALYHRRPVYMAFPTDYATSPVRYDMRRTRRGYQEGRILRDRRLRLKSSRESTPRLLYRKSSMNLSRPSMPD
jgi:TPP-dependent 2-oxoacid decarboxylase